METLSDENTQVTALSPQSKLDRVNNIEEGKDRQSSHSLISNISFSSFLEMVHYFDSLLIQKSFNVNSFFNGLDKLQCIQKGKSSVLIKLNVSFSLIPFQTDAFCVSVATLSKSAECLQSLKSELVKDAACCKKLINACLSHQNINGDRASVDIKIFTEQFLEYFAIQYD